MKKYYFTFGFGQVHQNCFTVIEAPDYESARVEMKSRFGTQWAMQYDEETWLVDGVTQDVMYSLKEVK